MIGQEQSVGQPVNGVECFREPRAIEAWIVIRRKAEQFVFRVAATGKMIGWFFRQFRPSSTFTLSDAELTSRRAKEAVSTSAEPGAPRAHTR